MAAAVFRQQIAVTRADRGERAAEHPALERAVQRPAQHVQEHAARDGEGLFVDVGAAEEHQREEPVVLLVVAQQHGQGLQLDEVAREAEMGRHHLEGRRQRGQGKTGEKWRENTI